MFRNCLKKMFGKFRNENGQAVVVVAISLTVLLGCAALVVDLGADYRAKMEVQNSADFAALAGARDLSVPQKAVNTATSVAYENSSDATEVTVNTPYEGDPTKIEVIVKKENTHLFARIFNSDSAMLVGRAVAKLQPPMWGGAAIPILNVDPYRDNYVDLNVIWNKKGSGGFGVFWFDEFRWIAGSNGVPGHFEIAYEDGITIQNGQIGGLQDDLEEMSSKGKIYIFSITNEAIAANKYQMGHNRITIQPEDLVLLECTNIVVKKHEIDVQVVSVYDVFGNYGEGKGQPSDGIEYKQGVPEDAIFVGEGYSSTLVE